MLEMLDVVIGLSVVMLFLSMAVTLITQLVVDTLNSRGSFLRGGIAELLHLIDAGIDAKTAKTIADFILRDEMIAGRVPGMSQRRLASAVHREELTKLILGFSEDLRGPLAVVQKAAPHELKVEGWVLGFFAGLARLLAAVTRRFSKDTTPSN